MRAIRAVAGGLCASGLGAAAPALAWGPEGHTVIARVATAQLSSQTARDLQWIVTVGVPALNAEISQKYGNKCQINPSDPWGSIPDFRTDQDQHTNLANWADCYRYLDSSTAGWHFDDIPLGDSPGGVLNASGQAWCSPSAGCVSVAFADNLRKLATPGLASADAARSLALVVHFMGDLHQPLHDEDNGDRGGNDVQILTKDSGVSGTELHGLWDTPLVAKALGRDLDAATTKVTSDVASADSSWINGTGSVDEVIVATDAWIEDAHTKAQSAYSLLGIPVGAGARQGVMITKTYVDTESAVVEQQIDMAALRLRAALNAALTWSAPQ
jgi:hypothetical protein